MHISECGFRVHFRIFLVHATPNIVDEADCVCSAVCMQLRVPCVYMQFRMLCVYAALNVVCEHSRKYWVSDSLNTVWVHLGILYAAVNTVFMALQMLWIYAALNVIYMGTVSNDVCTLSSKCCVTALWMLCVYALNVVCIYSPECCVYM